MCFRQIKPPTNQPTNQPGCWGQQRLLFWKLVDETQSGNPCEHAATDISSKFSILLALRAIYFRSYHYETPCILWEIPSLSCWGWAITKRKIFQLNSKKKIFPIFDGRRTKRQKQTYKTARASSQSKMIGEQFVSKHVSTPCSLIDPQLHHWGHPNVLLHY